MKNFRTSILVLVAGTIGSIAIGLYSALFLTSPFEAIVLSFLSEISVLLIAFGMLLMEMRFSIFSWLKDMMLWIKAGEYVATTRDEIYAERYRTISLNLADLAKGRYQLSSLSDVYDDDIRSIRQLSKGDSLFSMCPVEGSSDQAKAQLENKNFSASIKAHIDARNFGVTVHRIYIFQDENSYKSDISKTHLNYLISNKIKTYFVVLDDERFRDAHELPHDYIIFGARKVSVGRIGKDSRVSGGDVYADRETIERYRREYDRLLRISEEFSNSAEANGEGKK